VKGVGDQAAQQALHAAVLCCDVLLCYLPAVEKTELQPLCCWAHGWQTDTTAPG